MLSASRHSCARPLSGGLRKFLRRVDLMETIRKAGQWGNALGPDLGNLHLVDALYGFMMFYGDL